MKGFFECSVSFLEEGAEKQTKKVFLVDGITYTETESHVITYMDNYEGVNDFSLNSIKRTSYEDLIYKNEQAEYNWHEAIVRLSTDVDKELPYKYLVADITAEHAIIQLKSYLSDTDGKFRIVSIKEKQVDDIILFKKCCETCDTCESNVRVLSFEEQKGIERRFDDIDSEKNAIMEVLGAFELSYTKYKLKAFGNIDFDRFSRGKVLASNVCRKWSEDFIDEDSGDVVSIDRSEVIITRGTVIQNAEIDLILYFNIDFITLYR